jgi:hypothetical protein
VTTNAPAGQDQNRGPELPDEAVLRRLLLGQVTDAERTRLEETYFTSVEAFDRLLAVEEELTDEYVTGALSVADRRAFEQHFAVTPAGRRRLRSARVFHGALEELSRRLPPSDQPRTRRRLPLSAVAIVAAGVLAVAALLLAIERRQFRQEEAAWHAERAGLLDGQDALRQQVDALQRRTARIADSQAEFSCTQGRDNWYYGYYDGPFASTAFRLMTRCLADRDYGLGVAWWVDPARFWTSIRAAVSYPNGPESCGRQPVEQWAVRRWLSEVAGTVTVSGTVRTLLDKYDGYVAHIFVDGKSAWSATVPPGSPTSPVIPFQHTVAVERGTVIDFAVQPRWSDCNDHAEFLIFVDSDAPLRPGQSSR